MRVIPAAAASTVTGNFGDSLRLRLVGPGVRVSGPGPDSEVQLEVTVTVPSTTSTIMITSQAWARELGRSLPQCQPAMGHGRRGRHSGCQWHAQAGAGAAVTASLRTVPGQSRCLPDV